MTRFIVLPKELSMVKCWTQGDKRNLYSYEEFNSFTVYCETRNLKCILLRGNYETRGIGDKWNLYTLNQKNWKLHKPTLVLGDKRNLYSSEEQTTCKRNS